MLPIRFNVGSISNTKLVADIEVNIKDERRSLLYTPQPKADEVPLSYIGMPEATPDNIEVINSNEILSEVEVFENSIQERARYYFTNKVFNLPTERAVITAVTQTTASGRAVPLYYRHKIEDGLTTGPSILDEQGNEVSGQVKLVVEENEVALYHSLLPELNDSKRLKAYFISYTNSSNEQVVKLLDSEPAYAEASIVDGLDRSKRTYTTRERGGAYEYRILYQGSGPFFAKVTDDYQLKIKKPLMLKSKDSWYPEITNSKVFARVGNIRDKYSITEFPFQAFSPIEPIKYSGTVECEVITSQIIKLPKEDILFEDGVQFELLVTDKSITPEIGWTASGEPGQYWVDRMASFREQGSLIRQQLRSFETDGLSINKAFGLVSVPFELNDTHRVFARFKYNERRFIYRGLNLNPLMNSDMLTKRAVIYCIPESEVSDDLQSIYHLILDENNDIIEWSDERLGVGGTLDPSLVPGVGENGLDLFKQNFGAFLILGTVSIARQLGVNDLQYIDIREIGGGLTDSTEADLKKLLKTYPELQWASDESLKGRSIPANNAIVVKLPFEQLEQAGGNFSEAQLEAKVRKHLPLGVMPIIEYYATTPEILGVELDTATSEITIQWKDVSFADSYLVYISETPNDFVSTAVTTVTGDYVDSLKTTIGLSNAATVDIEVSLNTSLHLYVAPIKDSEEWPKGSTVVIDISQNQALNQIVANAVIAAAPSNTIQANAILI